ncbi:MAG: hypothetical protein UU23_C0004G0002 [Candidatus Curtissbacteria bacterium GW2011_GWA1_40_9]|uniref:Uncharacterized protein n=1 Tax=Candidatus Curtissbacteria bacterium GW2011_GWA1_40_9 TaxID=1618408 RepID=A0A0G0W101_9BACT|nr:MAG: hypothetical protein UU23_C0004G0002 [Candidatus Curtissbacteria bacterium GW2011_GWA1_40_9]
MESKGPEGGLPQESGGLTPSITAVDVPPKEGGIMGRIKRLFGRGGTQQQGTPMAEPLRKQPVTIDSGTPIPTTGNLSAGGSPDGVPGSLGSATTEAVTPGVGPTPSSSIKPE